MSYKKLQLCIDAWADYIYCDLGKPEALKDNLKGLWSRRIDEKIGLFILSKTMQL